MIATKQGNGVDLPDNIPYLRLVYLNELNCDRPETKPDNCTLKRDTKVIAWQRLKQHQSLTSQVYTQYNYCSRTSR